MNLLQTFKNSSFVRNSLTLIFGTALAQLIPILLQPILRRSYREFPYQSPVEATDRHVLAWSNKYWLRRLWLVRHIEHTVRQPLIKRVVVAPLFEQFHVISQHRLCQNSVSEQNSIVPHLPRSPVQEE